MLRDAADECGEEGTAVEGVGARRVVGEVTEADEFGVPRVCGLLTPRFRGGAVAVGVPGVVGMMEKEREKRLGRT